MFRLINLFLAGTLLTGLLLCSVPAQAKQSKYMFKVASLAPDGSIWAKRFQAFVREVGEKTDGEIGFKVYAGGVMGDDQDMYRKMKIGQLHGGGFTMTGIGEIVPDFRVIGLPFLFRSYDEADCVIQGIWPRFEKAFAEKNLVLLATSEVGFIYTMSTEPVLTLTDLKKTKSWTPEGDPISIVFFESIGITPIPLSIPDVLTALQTGLIDTVYNSFYGSIVLQWFTRTKYITDVPFAYAYGAFVLDKKMFSRLPPDYAAILETSAKKHFARLLEDTRNSNAEALQVLKNNGIKLLEITPATYDELLISQKEAVAKLVGDAFSKEIYEETVQILTDFRAKKKDQ